LAFGLCLLPLVWLLYAAINEQLGANPAEALIRATGDWALRFLCLALAVTPLRVLTNTPALARFRRMLGLFVYFYVVLHALSYSGFDMGFEVADIARDIVKRDGALRRRSVIEQGGREGHQQAVACVRRIENQRAAIANPDSDLGALAEGHASGHKARRAKGIASGIRFVNCDQKRHLSAARGESVCVGV
jgi:hypothetical protein